MPTYCQTRIAPTPSGYLHLGNVLSFVLTAALAHETGAKILLRIDDLDRGRVNPSYVQDIFDTLDLLRIAWHNGPRNLQEYDQQWSQMHRLQLYDDALLRLKEQGAVYACNCSRAQIRATSLDDTYPGTCRHKNIPLDAEGVSWRLKTDEDKLLKIKTASGEIIEAHLPANMRDLVVRKKDGYPAYQLSSVIDDIHFGTDLIVRGQDLWASTLAQQYLAGYIGADSFKNIAFYHHPLLMAGNNKLSKSAGDTSVRYLRGEGKTPADIFTATAAMLGINKRVSTWMDLAAIVDKAIK